MVFHWASKDFQLSAHTKSPYDLHRIGGLMGLGDLPIAGVTFML